MPEKHESDTMLDLYENAVADNLKDLDEEEDSVEIISPILDPRVKLPENFPDIGIYIENLGESPISIKHDFLNLKVIFSEGYVHYNFDLEDFRYYPKSLTLLDPKHSNTLGNKITFNLIKNEEINRERIDWDIHFLVNKNRVLRINLPENNFLDYYEHSLKDRKLWIAQPLVDPRIIIPLWSGKITKLIKQLGKQVISIDTSMEKFTILFEGGEVMYCTHPDLKKAVPDTVTIYGVTAAPGVRSNGTKDLDTRISFTLLEPKECKNIKVDEDVYFYAQRDFLLKVDIKEPEDTNIKNYWVKE